MKYVQIELRSRAGFAELKNKKNVNLLLYFSSVLGHGTERLETISSSFVDKLGNLGIYEASHSMSALAPVPL